MEIKDIQTMKDFERFSLETPAEIVRKLSTEDWLQIYEKFDKIRQNEFRGFDHHTFMFIYGQPLAKLYRNYRMEKKYAEGVIQVAEDAVENLCAAYPDILENIKSIAVNKDNRLQENLAERIMKSVYNSAYFNRVSKTLSRPRISIKSRLSGHARGVYNNINHEIEIDRHNAADSLVAAHEIFHSIQGIRKIPVLFQKLGMVKGYEDATLTKLFWYNGKYYADCEGRKDPAFPSYFHQPIEYSAELFGVIFTRRLNHKINYAREGLTAIKTVQNLLMDFNLKPDQIKYNSVSQSIRVEFQAINPMKTELIQEINRKYLKASKELSDNKIHLNICSEYANLRRLELAHRGIAKRFHNESLGDYEKIFRHEFPEFCYKYPSAIEQKQKTKEQEKSQEKAFDKKKGIPQIFKNLKDFMIEK